MDELSVNRSAWRRFVDWAQVVGALFAVVGVALGFYTWLSSRSAPSLTYAFDRVSMLAAAPTEQAEAADKIQILYEGQPVPNVFLLQASVANTGDTNLKREQVRVPVTFTFGEGTRVLDQAVTRTDPPGVECSLQPDDGHLILDFDLLNPRDKIYVQFLCAGASSEPEVWARIEGLDAPQKGSWEAAQSTPGLLQLFSLLLCGVLAGGLTVRGRYRLLTPERRLSVFSVLFIALAFLMPVLLLLVIWAWQLSRAAN